MRYRELHRSARKHVAYVVPGKDVRIEFTGMRPGEKLFEELYFSAEKVLPTAHPRIFCLRSDGTAETDDAVLLCLEQLRRIPCSDDPVLAVLRDDLARWVNPAAREGSLA